MPAIAAPRPRAAPLTMPNTAAVTSTAAARPSSNGTPIAASTSHDRNRHASSPATSRVEAIDTSSTSCWIAAAASAANTAGPLRSSVASVPAAAVAKAWRSAATAADCAGPSSAPARVAATRSARSRALSNHAPSKTRTGAAPPQPRSSPANAPVGSASPYCNATDPADDRSARSTPTMPSCSAASSIGASVSR